MAKRLRQANLFETLAKKRANDEIEPSALLTEQRLNHCLLLHVHKHITDSLDIKSITKEFIATSEERRAHFGTF